jgi:hypothetical protein
MKGHFSAIIQDAAELALQYVENIQTASTCDGGTGSILNVRLSAFFSLGFRRKSIDINYIGYLVLYQQCYEVYCSNLLWYSYTPILVWYS